MARGRPKTKFGKRKNFYLSNEVLLKLDRLSPKNQTGLIEALILRKYKEVYPNESQENMDN